ncbi:MAG TPA: hypothetical protein VMW37_02020 [Dehalococcoidales bacterium]|nr:hypothetical protein [Dehalococcoidales bacterium]
MNDVLFIVLMVLLFIAVVLVVPQWMLSRNVPKVIRIFRQRNAVGEKNAKTIEELGLQPKSMFQRMLNRRDYKPQALQFLIRATVVDMTEEGKVYLNEETLMQTKWRNL